jgi:hypothetical protein
MNFRFHKMQEVSWLAERRLLSISQDGLCSMEEVSHILKKFNSCRYFLIYLYCISMLSISIILGRMKGWSVNNEFIRMWS